MAVYTKLSRNDGAAIAKKFALGAVQKLEGIPKGSVNTNYRLVTSKGTYFVRLDERREAEAVMTEHRLVDHLAGKGFPTPKPLADAKGKRILLLRKKPLVVYPWLPGADKEAQEYTPADLVEAGAMLARLHRAAEGFPERLPNRFGVIATQARWAEIREDAQIPESHRKEIDEGVASLTREPAPQGPGGVIHGDWFCDNLLFEKTKITGVLDFDAAATEHLTFDVATAVNALCWLPKDPDRFQAPRVQALLLGYARDRGPAAMGDHILGWWLRATALRFTVTRILDFNMRKSSVRVEKDYRDFLKRYRFWSKPKAMASVARKPLPPKPVPAKGGRPPKGKGAPPQPREPKEDDESDD